MAQGSEFKVQGSGSRVQGLGVHRKEGVPLGEVSCLEYIEVPVVELQKWTLC